jgi:hypothetical protein
MSMRGRTLARRIGNFHRRDRPTSQVEIGKVMFENRLPADARGLGIGYQNLRE